MTYYYKPVAHQGGNPSTRVVCPTCGSPPWCYCIDAKGEPIDGPHQLRKVAAGTAKVSDD